MSTSSDDASMAWIGDVAKSGWTLGNAVVDNSGLHGTLEKSGTIGLVAGRYYLFKYSSVKLGQPMC